MNDTHDPSQTAGQPSAIAELKQRIESLNSKAEMHRTLAAEARRGAAQQEADHQYCREMVTQYEAILAAVTPPAGD